jgi:uncharacterized membrane protein
MTPHPADAKPTARLEAFSDGVFAIAITLLAFSLIVPSPVLVTPESSLAALLLMRWPSYLAFLVSFLFILVMWINHHRLTGLLARVDHALLMWNGLLLLCVSLVPFGSTLMAEYMLLPDGPTAAAVYSALLLITALVFNGFWHRAAHGRRLLGAHVNDAQIRAIERQYRFGPWLYAGALVLAAVSVALSVGLVVAMAVYFILPLRTEEAV